MSAPKLVVDTDILMDHLGSGRFPSVLRRAMGAFFCYTTVFQAIELFSRMHTPRERQAAEDALAAMKVLGLNPKSAPAYGRLFAAHPGRKPADLLVAGLCIESRLPLLTGRRAHYAGVRGLTLISPRLFSGKTGVPDTRNEHGR